MDRDNTPNLPNVPYIVYEETMVKFERTIKRLWVLGIILIICLVLTNSLWVYYESQWEVVETTTVTQDLDAHHGDAIINDGVHINGESETDSNQD